MSHHVFISFTSTIKYLKEYIALFGGPRICDIYSFGYQWAKRREERTGDWEVILKETENGLRVVEFQWIDCEHVCQVTDLLFCPLSHSPVNPFVITFKSSIPAQYIQFDEWNSLISGFCGLTMTLELP